MNVLSGFSIQLMCPSILWTTKLSLEAILEATTANISSNSRTVSLTSSSVSLNHCYCFCLLYTYLFLYNWMKKLLKKCLRLKRLFANFKCFICWFLRKESRLYRPPLVSPNLYHPTPSQHPLFHIFPFHIPITWTIKLICKLFQLKANIWKFHIPKVKYSLIHAFN